MTVKDKDKEQTFTFKAEIKQLLQILVHSLYQDKEIFLRELVSNSSDALSRLSFEMLTNKDLVDPEAELAIHIDTPEVEEGEAKIIIIKDSGIGMNAAELQANLGTIAQSGAREFLSKLAEGQTSTTDIIGQFGVGFYSVFMIADEVRVVSRSHRAEDEAAVWISDGSDNYRIEPSDKTDRGTEIHITLKKDDAEFADSWRIRQIIKKHSDFVNYPIYIGEEQANEQESLWRKQPSEVKDEEYNQFFQQMTLEFEPPISSVHFSSDMPVNLRSLLFIPAKRERSVFSIRKRPGLKLYSNNVLIQEYCTDLLPKWLEFIEGVVDSEQLPLNVSRETVQNNRIMRQISKTLRKKILRELKKVAKDDPEKYQIFWKQFGRVFKEGVAIDPEAKEDLLPFFRFHSSEATTKDNRSLDDYIAAMSEDQEEIYYLLGDDIHSVKNSPHLDPFKSRNLEVLYWIDPLDAFMAPSLQEYEGKKFRNIDDSTLELPSLPEDEKTEEEKDETNLLSDETFDSLIKLFSTQLDERVIEVRASKILKNSPVRLVSPEDATNKEMQRVYRLMNEDYEIPKKILEINRNHALIVKLSNLLDNDAKKELLELTVEQLFIGALVQEGLHPNPAEMLPRIQQLMDFALNNN